MTAFKNDTTEKPAFTIQMYSNKRSYNPGENVIISAFIVGSGQLDESSIHGYVPNELTSDKITLFFINFDKFEKDGKIYCRPKFPRFEKNVLNRFSGKLADCYFMVDPDKGTNYGDEILVNSQTKEQFTPISIDFTLNHKVPAGNHKIDLILKFKSNGQWFISRENVVIHINNWIEKHQNALQYFVFFVGILALIEAVFSVLQYLKC